MYKLVILLNDYDERNWPAFLHLVEGLPGLRREATTRLTEVLAGAAPAPLVHELFFDTREALQMAMASPLGHSAGRLLQTMSRGQVGLFIAEHYEESADALQKQRKNGTVVNRPPKTP